VVPGSIIKRPAVDDDEFRKQIDGNVLPGSICSVRRSPMVRNGSGSFVAISSTAAVFSARYLASYSAGRQRSTNSYGSRPTSSEPSTSGSTRCSGHDRALRQPRCLRQRAMTGAFLDAQPLHRSGEVADVAEAVRYFAARSHRGSRDNT